MSWAMLLRGDLIHLQPPARPSSRAGKGFPEDFLSSSPIYTSHIDTMEGCFFAWVMQNFLAEMTPSSFFLGLLSWQGCRGGVLYPAPLLSCLLSRIHFPLALPFLPPFLSTPRPRGRPSVPV